MKIRIFTLLALACLFISCGKNDPVDPKPVPPDPPVPEYDTIPKPRALWLSYTVNVTRTNTKSNVKDYVKKIAEAGFNELILEVKVSHGGAKYQSDILPVDQKRSWDYLGYFIEQCHKRGMKIDAAVTTMTNAELGETAKYKDSFFENKYSKELTAQGIKDIRTVEGREPFLNPSDPDVRTYVLDICKEIVTKYPDLDGLVMDYCRYHDYHSDFSDLSRSQFEEYQNAKVENWPDDIMKIAPDGSETYGPLFNKWLEWRSWIVTDYVQDIRTAIKAINPEISFQYWASAWWPCYSTGQNWSSDKTNITKSYWWATRDYYKTGFAKYLDVFQVGAYTSNIDGTGTSGIYGLLNQAKSIIKKDCGVWGSFSIPSADFDTAKATNLTLKETDGLMIFELCYMVKYKQWDNFKKGWQKAWDEGTAYTLVKHKEN